ncbi:MAG: hypothetical protein AAF725_18460 [Acidobacteriota bacterium]
MTVKEQVLKAISQMPDDSTMDDIGYQLHLLENGLNRREDAAHFSGPEPSIDELTPARVRSTEPPQNLPVAVWEDLRAEIDQDREDR